LVQNDHARAEIDLSGPLPGLAFHENVLRDAENGIDTGPSLASDAIRVCGNRFSGMIDREAVDLGLAVDEVVLRGNAFVDNAAGIQVDDTVETLQAERNLFQNTTTTGLITQAQLADIRNNSFTGNGKAVRVTGFLEGGAQQTNLTGNWWSDPSGPNVTGLNLTGPGSGQILDVAEFVPRGSVTWDPWLTEEPAAGPTAVDCGVPGEQVGARHEHPVTAKVAGSASATVGVE
jgi:hypothetical protein